MAGDVDVEPPEPGAQRRRGAHDGDGASVAVGKVLDLREHRQDHRAVEPVGIVDEDDEIGVLLPQGDEGADLLRPKHRPGTCSARWGSNARAPDDDDRATEVGGRPGEDVECGGPA